MTRLLVYRPVWLPLLVAASLMLAALVLLAATARQGYARVQPLHDQAGRLEALQTAALQVQGALLEALEVGKDDGRAQRANELRAALGAVEGRQEALSDGTRGKLRAVLSGPPEDLAALQKSGIEVLRDLRGALKDAATTHGRTLEALKRDTQRELRLAAALLVVFPGLLALILYLLRDRILLPLESLGRLMYLLGERAYRPATLDGVDPLLRPLFGNYNRMVERLAALEQEHATREGSLQAEVRTATQALLQQSRRLAESERLAVAGEMAAGIAHELRNPLAGIQLACGKLRRQVHEPDQVQKLDLVIRELKRLSQLLTTLLDQSRVAPEPTRELDLSVTLSELLALARYQVPEAVRLDLRVPAALRCRLPEAQLRQAVLNLVLNAAQAVGERPGSIVVQAEMAGGELSLSVSDDGPGFPQDLLDFGVQAFASWRATGTGLGLAIVRRFAADLGGDLSLANRAAGGACATLRLPCGESHG